MRIIKFRAKDTCAGAWIYGPNVWLGHGNIDADGKVLTHAIINNMNCVKETLGQFTGMQDCNGKDIYEGDILRVPRKEFFHSEIVGLVCFIKGCFTVASLLGGTERIDTAWKSNLEMCISDGAEIIGNMHDNAELLND